MPVAWVDSLADAAAAAKAERKLLFVDIFKPG